jgi:hypothetical protein
MRIPDAHTPKSRPLRGRTTRISQQASVRKSVQPAAVLGGVDPGWSETRTRRRTATAGRAETDAQVALPPQTADGV